MKKTVCSIMLSPFMFLFFSTTYIRERILNIQINNLDIRHNLIYEAMSCKTHSFPNVRLVRKYKKLKLQITSFTTYYVIRRQFQTGRKTLPVIISRKSAEIAMGNYCYRFSQQLEKFYNTAPHIFSAIYYFPDSIKNIFLYTCLSFELY